MGQNKSGSFIPAPALAAALLTAPSSTPLLCAVPGQEPAAAAACTRAETDVVRTDTDTAVVSTAGTAVVVRIADTAAMVPAGRTAGAERRRPVVGTVAAAL